MNYYCQPTEHEGEHLLSALQRGIHLMAGGFGRIHDAGTTIRALERKGMNQAEIIATTGYSKSTVGRHYEGRRIKAYWT